MCFFRHVDGFKVQKANSVNVNLAWLKMDSELESFTTHPCRHQSKSQVSYVVFSHLLSNSTGCFSANEHLSGGLNKFIHGCFSSIKPYQLCKISEKVSVSMHI